MSTTVTYKGSTLATVENATKTLKTAGKYMEGDVTLTDVSSAAPTLQAKSNIAPTTSSQTITPDSGYDGLSSVQINAISPIRTSSSVTVSGATVTVPNGYYSSQVSKSVSTGTAGTPTATKGTVSNHAVSVTPSVTNSTGYIAGGTKTGTAVSVSASELVSGTKSITANGAGIDVTNYSSVDVNVSGGGGTTETCTVTIDNGVIECSNFSNGTPTGTYVALFRLVDRDHGDNDKCIGIFVACSGATNSNDTINTACFFNDPSSPGYYGIVLGFDAWAYVLGNYGSYDYGGDYTTDVYDGYVGTYTATVIRF